MKNVFFTTTCALVIISVIIRSSEAQQGAPIAACVPLVQPQTPANLQAIPGDGNITVSWAAPGNDACFDFYNVTYYPVGPEGLVGPSAEMKTTLLNATLTHLSNGVKYTISVTPASQKYNTTVPATVVSMPRAECNTSISPGAPVNLTAYSENLNVKLCWEAPRTGGCATEYRIGMRMVPVTTAETASATWMYTQVSTAGCMIIPSLKDRRTYQFAVESYSQTAKSGGYAGIETTVVNEWRCLPVPGYYPLCASATSGACNPISCEQQATANRCNAPWLRQMDASTKTVVQYCADLCGCSLNATMTAPSAEPSAQVAVFRMDGPSMYQSPDGCCHV